jgi:hypothetical protein
VHIKYADDPALAGDFQLDVDIALIKALMSIFITYWKLRRNLVAPRINGGKLAF